MAFFHGARSSEVPTSLLSPVEVDSAITVAWGTAPVHLAANPAKANEPVLCYELSEYVNKFGATTDFENYTLAEVASSQFQLFRVAPTIFINVLDPEKHFNEREISTAATKNNPVEIDSAMLLDTIKITSSGEETITLTENTEYEIISDGTDTTVSILADVTLPSDSIAIEYTQTDETIVQATVAIVDLPYTLPLGATNLKITAQNSFTNILTGGEDFTAAYNDANKVIVTFLDDAKIIDELVNISWHELDPTQVTTADIIGGVDNAGNSTGIELIEDIYKKFRVVPSILISPKYSTDPTVAAVLKAKCTNINEIFNAIALVDIPADLSYTDVAEWKNSKNLVDKSLVVCYPKISLGGVQYHLSTQLASLMATVDHSNTPADVPFVSPSNKNLQMDASVLSDGTEQFLSLPQANYLNSVGVVTALNFSLGWVAWGNSTSRFPSSTDPVERFISIRRTMNWIANSLVITYFSQVDAPINKRLIDRIVDSVNIWMNGLTAAGAILGGRIVFDSGDNSTTDLLAGNIKFRIYVTPCTPAEKIEFILEFDPDYFETLFN